MDASDLRPGIWVEGYKFGDQSGNCLLVQEVRPDPDGRWVAVAAANTTGGRMLERAFRHDTKIGVWGQL